ncbi:MAG: PDZ domain-containing protein [Actinomycetia bacterium]|nr:PDZ domain-containing protein [Actinomycetes bacterium]
MSRRSLTLFAASAAALVLVCVAALIPVPYVTMKPGPTFDTLGRLDEKPLFQFSNSVETYPTKGQLRFTTVSVTSADSDLTLGQAVTAWFDDTDAVVPRDVIYPEGQTVEEAEQQTSMQMSSSQTLSEAVALRAAGYDVHVKVEKPVDPKGPSAGKLEIGDTILAVDGDKVDSPDDVVTEIAPLDPGSKVKLEIERGREKRDVTITTEPHPEDDSMSRIGIGVGYDFPFKVKNHVSEDVGGPSAGTMFALAMYDELTRGSLTGGDVVAGTGTIADDGTVGPIGGIQQKIAGAAAADATIFLTPTANCEEAVAGGDHGMELVEVKSFDQAVTSLQALADDPDAEVPRCK